MNVSAFAFIFFLLVWSSQSEKTYNFTAWKTGSQTKPSQNYTLTSGSTVRFRCQYSDKNPTALASWFKEKCSVSRTFLSSSQCRVNTNTTTCTDVTVPSSFECDTKNSIRINITVEDSGGWRCIYYHSPTHYYVSKMYYVEVKPSTTAKGTRSPAPPESTTDQIKERPSSVREGIHETGTDHNTTQRPAEPTGSQAASNNFLLPVVGASVGGLLIITLIAVIIAVKRKRSPKGGRTTEPPNDENVPEAEMIDPDGQYASIGQMEVPKMEPNPMYESYEGNQNQNQDQNQNQNQSGSISFAQDTGGDVYSVVQKKKQDSPATDVVQSTTDQDTGGDVYSVVQKKKQDQPDTEGVHSTPEQGITDVYSVVQKPGKTPQ